MLTSCTRRMSTKHKDEPRKRQKLTKLLKTKSFKVSGVPVAEPQNYTPKSSTTVFQKFKMS